MESELLHDRPGASDDMITTDQSNTTIQSEIVSNSANPEDGDTALVDISVKRAIAYIRVSTKAQAERDGNPEGYSLPTQRAACISRARQLGAVIADEYIDKDSGTKIVIL